MNKIKRQALVLAKKVKKIKDIFFLPLIRLLDYFHFTPNLLTILSLISGILAAIFLQFSKNWFLLFILLFFLFDMLDGGLARFQKSSSKMGWYIDFITDRFVILSVIFSSTLILHSNYLLLALYFLYNLFYIITKREYQIIYFEFIYCILIYFSISIATTFFITTSILNLLVIFIGLFLTKFLFRKL